MALTQLDRRSARRADEQRERTRARRERAAIALLALLIPALWMAFVSLLR